MINDAVEAALQEPKKIVSTHSGNTGRLLIVRSELSLSDAVDSSQLLLRPQLNAVLGLLAPDLLTMLTGRIAPALKGALLQGATLPFEKQLGSLAPTESAVWSSISTHSDLLLRRS